MAAAAAAAGLARTGEGEGIVHAGWVRGLWDQRLERLHRAAGPGRAEQKSEVGAEELAVARASAAPA